MTQSKGGWALWLLCLFSSLKAKASRQAPVEAFVLATCSPWAQAPSCLCG